MEISSSLLVTIMFVIVLSLGIANILMSLAAVINRRAAFKSDRLHTSWMVLLLLIHFNLFWYALEILGVESWRFLDFLYMISGPMLMFFATSVLLPDASDPDAADIRGHYLGVSTQFFTLLALQQFWVIGAEFFLGHGFASGSWFNLAMAALALVMAASKSPRLHGFGTVAAWLLLLAFLAMRGAGIVA